VPLLLVIEVPTTLRPSGGKAREGPLPDDVNSGLGPEAVEDKHAARGRRVDGSLEVHPAIVQVGDRLDERLRPSRSSFQTAS